MVLLYSLIVTATCNLTEKLVIMFHILRGWLLQGFVVLTHSHCCLQLNRETCRNVPHSEGLISAGLWAAYWSILQLLIFCFQALSVWLQGSGLPMTWAPSANQNVTTNIPAGKKALKKTHHILRTRQNTATESKTAGSEQNLENK